MVAETERRQRVVSRLKAQLKLLPLPMFVSCVSGFGRIYGGWLLMWENLELQR